LDVLRSYNITEFLCVFAHFLSTASALSGSFVSHCCEVARNPTELIGQFRFASLPRLHLHAIAGAGSYLF
jgi:hypothetical protein